MEGGVLRINLTEQNIFKLIWAKCVLFVVWPRKDYWGILHGPPVTNYSYLQTVWLGTPTRKRILKRYGENCNWHFQQLTKNLKSIQKNKQTEINFRWWIWTLIFISYCVAWGRRYLKISRALYCYDFSIQDVLIKIFLLTLFSGFRETGSLLSVSLSVPNLVFVINSFGFLLFLFFLPCFVFCFRKSRWWHNKCCKQ